MPLLHELLHERRREHRLERRRERRGWRHRMEEADSYEHRAYNEVINTHPEHRAKLSHELLAGAAAYEAAKMYEEHCEAVNGKPDSHAKAKELVAGFAGAFIDRMIETKGMDAWDKYKDKEHFREETARRAVEHSEGFLAEEYRDEYYHDRREY
ncbi:hypothetical protein B0H13DRAFT_1157200 [Mycena leptocephala]|nr:hypothetical protein B0H13DRAFT_1157200 [Mycena leptocephala]